METNNYWIGRGDYVGAVVGMRGPGMTFRRTLAAVVVVALVTRAFLRGGLDSALGATIALGVGALILSLLIEFHTPGRPPPEA